MRIIKLKPSRQQIEEILKNSYELLYLEGIKNLSRREISRYNSKILQKNFKNNNFVIVKQRDGFSVGMAVFHSLDWDTKYLGQKSAKIELIVTNNNVSNRTEIYRMLLDEIFSSCKKNKIKLLFFRNSINNSTLNQYLTSIEVHPISTLLNLCYSFDRMEDKKNYCKKINVQIRQPKKSEFPQLEDVMVDGFKNRLLHEPLFKAAGVRNLYRQWIRNDLKGRVKEVLVALSNGRIAGFVAFDRLNINNKKFGFIDMIVVDRRFRKKGVGTVLVNEVVERLHKITKAIFLGTELENSEALNFYMSLGFKIVGSSFTYHIKLDKQLI